MAERLRRGSGIELELAKPIGENVHNLLQSLQVSENVQNLFHNRSQITWKPMEMREPTHKKMGKVLTCKIFISFFTNRAAMEANGDEGADA
nr:hypothetical protein Iba_chr13aCG6460 [Ipomoea batatas]